MISIESRAQSDYVAFHEHLLFFLSVLRALAVSQNSTARSGRTRRGEFARDAKKKNDGSFYGQKYIARYCRMQNAKFWLK